MYVTSIYFETFKVEILKIYSLCDRYLVPTLSIVHYNVSFINLQQHAFKLVTNANNICLDLNMHKCIEAEVCQNH